MVVLRVVLEKVLVVLGAVVVLGALLGIVLVVLGRWAVLAGGGSAVLGWLWS